MLSVPRPHVKSQREDSKRPAQNLGTGRIQGWEFEIPDNVKGHIAEMNEESVPGSYEETPDVASRQGEATMTGPASTQSCRVVGQEERRTVEVLSFEAV